MTKVDGLLRNISALMISLSFRQFLFEMLLPIFSLTICASCVCCLICPPFLALVIEGLVMSSGPLLSVRRLLQMVAVLSTLLYDLMISDSVSAQKAQLFTLRWREIISVGLATALWALICLSETPWPPPDTVRTI
jgi:hypothetical protein